MPESYVHIDLILQLASAPDGQLDAAGRRLCAAFDGSDPVRFLRDLLDLCVRYGWASGFVVKLIEWVLAASSPPETETEAADRRRALLTRWEPSAVHA